MITDKKQLKQTLAKEILIFFGGLGIVLIVLISLILRNSYFDNKVKSCSEKLKTSQIQLNRLPNDYVKDFYDHTNKYFVLNYKLGQDTYAIPKEQEEMFLYDEFGVKKNVRLLPINPKGYSNFHCDIFKKYGGHELYPKRTANCTDSTIVFDFVPYEKFLELINSKDYQEKLFSVFSSSNKQFISVTINSLIENQKFVQLERYNGIYDLGTLSEFISKINTGLKVIEELSKLETEIQRQNELILSSNNSLLTSEGIKSILINMLIIIGLLLYPVRLSALLLLWALRTVKKVM